MEKFNETTFKQVHLDFHTSPDIKEIGKNFSKENFKTALKKGNVDSVTVFAKCHHSYCYYPTKTGTMHPHLDFDLTGEMIDSAHEIGVKAPVYITAGWSHKDAIDHKEWIALNYDGSYQTMGTYDENASSDTPKSNYVWYNLCLGDGEYARHIYELTEEICQRYEIDGLFYDICLNGDVCYCDSCKKGMKEMGLNPHSEDDARKYYILKRQVFMEKCANILKKYHKDATIFFNGSAELNTDFCHKYQSHFEMEDLPTSGAGYDKLPLRGKFFRGTGKPTIGMTGKFHLSWGEFGGFKTKDALKYEVATMALYGAGASIGDQLHPDGEMDYETYENIGYAYNYLEKIAPFCYDGEIVTNLGLFLSDNQKSNEGISKILIENQLDYDIVRHNNFEKFDTVIISESAVMDKEGISSLKTYINNGGKVLLMADALVSEGNFLIDTGTCYTGVGEFDCDYIIPSKDFPYVPKSPLLSYMPGHTVKNIDAEIYAEINFPYFNRTYGHFCGHKNTPYDKNSKKIPAITKKGNVVYLAHSFPAQYMDFGSVFHKQYFINALNLVYSGPVTQIKGMPFQGRISTIHQKKLSRYCINLTCATPAKRNWAEIIEDIIPLYNLEIKFKTEKQIKNVYCGITGEKIEFILKEDTLIFTVKELNCHTSIVIEY